MTMGIHHYIWLQSQVLDNGWFKYTIDNIYLPTFECIGHVEIAELLIKKHANIDAKTKDGSTPLWVAAKSGHAKFVKFLLENDADPNIRGAKNLTPLEIARKKGKFILCTNSNVKFLLK